MSAFLKSLLTSVLVLAFCSNSPAFAAVGNSDPAVILELMDEYLAQTTPRGVDSVANALISSAQMEYMAAAVASQVLGLEPEDFNGIFLINFMDRYVNHPEQRAALFEFIKIVRQQIAPDLANTATVNEGPAHYLIHGSYNNLFEIVALGVLGWKAIMATPLRKAALMRALGEKEARLGRFRVYRYGTRVALHPLTLTLAGGSLYGGFRYLLESHRTHRLDPADMLKVVQAQLACKISYEVLDLHEHVDALVDESEKLIAEAPGLRIQLSKHLKEAQTLQLQFPWLANLNVGDRLFQKITSTMPKTDLWRRYKTMLNDVETHDGECSQISFENVARGIMSIAETLDALAPMSPATLLNAGRSAPAPSPAQAQAPASTATQP